MLTAALVEQTIFCMHGGLSPSLLSFEQVGFFLQHVCQHSALIAIMEWSVCLSVSKSTQF